MERSILLLIMITGVLYLVIDEMIGPNKYLSRFVSNTVPSLTIGEIVFGKVDPKTPIMETPEGDPITVEEFEKAIQEQHI